MPTNWRRLAAIVLLSILGTTGAAAQEYPSKPIRIVVPVAPGGLTDILTRTLAQKLGERMKQPVIVENKPGAGGILGMEYAARSPSDGYTLLMVYPGPVVVNPWIYKTLPYDPARDFVPVYLIASYSLVLAVHPSVPAKSVREFIELAKASPGRISYGSAGNATTSHLAMELFRREAGIDLVHVPYKGAAPALNDLIAGQVSVVFDSVSLILPQAKAGKLRALGISSKEPSPAMPDVPAISESGVKDFEVIGWYGIMAPAGIPKHAIDILSHELSAILKDPAVRTQLENRGLDLIGADADRFARLLAMEREKWRRVVTDARIRVD